jgi:flagella basal body P-ring formation protein FlgA
VPLPFFLLCSVLFAGSALAGQAAPYAGDGKAITQAAESFMVGWSDEMLTRLGGDARISYSIAGLDPRLAMPACAEPLAVEAREQRQLNARLNLQVSCRSGNGWSLFVPIEIAVLRPIVVAARPLAHGETLAAGDLQLVEHNVARLTGQYFTSPDEAVDMAVRRPLAQGAPVLGEQLQPPLLVKRGDAVLITAAGSTIAVKMNGIAMTDGRRGEQIRVRNSSSGKIVAARVAATGVVEVTL